MIVVAVSMVISTMDGKSCIDLHNARTEMFQNLVFHISRNHNDKITEAL